MKNLSPIKKIVLGLAAMCVAISIITANNLASVMMLIAAKNNAQNNAQVVQTQSTVQQGAVQQSSSTSTGTGTSTATPSTGTSTSTDTGSTGGSASTGGASTGTAADANTPADTGASTGTKTVAEIVKMYNTAVNNAKSKSSSIIRVKDGAINYNGIVKAGNLSSVGETLMGMFMVGSEADIQPTNEPWTAEKLPPENAQAGLQESGVAKADCNEDGDFYVLTITGKNETNPKSGGPGVGSLCGVIEESTITGSISSVPGLELNNISIAYENVTVVAKVDKSTGNLVNLQINAPCILSLDAKVPLLGSIDGAQVGIQVITEYSIAY